MLKRLAAQNVRLFLVCAVFSMLMGMLSAIDWYGETVQVAHKAFVDSNTRLFCADGSRVKDHIVSEQRWMLSYLTEFGEQARTLWKTCVCSGFENTSCAALETEVRDQVRLTRLDRVQ